MNPDIIEKYTKNQSENEMTLMNLMNMGWVDVQMMPYPRFIELLTWKIELENAKQKKMEERSRNTSSKKKVNAVTSRMSKNNPKR